jgi:hypothetical protein
MTEGSQMTSGADFLAHPPEEPSPTERGHGGRQVQVIASGGGDTFFPPG